MGKQAVLVASLVVTAGVLGFRKEQDRMGLLATRLSFDRDIALELRLRRMETQIAEALDQYSRSEQSIQNYIVNYFSAINERDYLVSARVVNDFNNTARLKNSTPSRGTVCRSPRTPASCTRGMRTAARTTSASSSS